MKRLKVVLNCFLLLMFILVPAVVADATYQVQPGDNLSKIAKRFNTSVESIVAANDIQDPNVLLVGTELLIPDAQPQAEPAAIELPILDNLPIEIPLPTIPAVPGVPAVPAAESGDYLVDIGDNLFNIALQFGTDYLTLADLNNLSEPFNIMVGQILNIPGVTGIPLPELGGVENPAAPVPVSDGETTDSTAAKPAVTTAVTSAAAPRVWESTISIPTYQFDEGFVATSEGDGIYPYPRLDFSRVGGPAAQAYKAVTLENGYISVTVLPELGGRVYSLKDKATGRELLYQNPVIKPTNWGYREWWLAAGGIEWAFPVSEHGLNEWRPWNYSTAANSINVSDVDDRTGMEVGATLSLDANHSYLTIQPWAQNTSSSAQPYQLWLNGMLAPGGNTVSKQTQFIVPAGQVTVHSTGDPDLPGAGSALSWPVYDNRDLSYYGSWNGWLGFFAPTGAGFSGVYDHNNGQGLVRAHAPGWPGGLKIFGPGTLSPSLWTDGSSNYVEMWSGATGSFDQNATLEPGQRVDWTEYWYPINQTGGFNFANQTAALRLQDNGGGADVGLAVSTPVNGELLLFAGNQEAARWPVSMGPGQSLKASWSRGAGQDGALGLRLVSGGQTLAQTGQVP